MGKQTRFHMTHADEQEYLSTLREKFAPLNLVKSASSSRIEIIDTLTPAKGVTSDLFLVRASDLDELIIQYFPNIRRYCIDGMNSPVVQFCRCEPKAGWLANGRIWFDERNMVGWKSGEFRTWANKILRWTRRRYAHLGEGFYAAPEALQRSEEGALRLGPSHESIPYEIAKRVLGLG